MSNHEIDPRFAAAHYGNDLIQVNDIKTRLQSSGTNTRLCMEAASHIAMLESEAEQLRMSWKNARIALADASKDAARYQWLRDSNNQKHEDDICVSDSSFNTYFHNDLDVAIDAATKGQQ